MKKYAILAAASLVSATAAFAQTQNGNITGVITDASGAAVPGATVTVTNLSTGAVRTVVTDGAGVYDVEQLPPQSYKLSISAPGFAPSETRAFAVAVGSSNKVNAQLSVQESSEKIDVSANNLGGINLENAEQSQVIDSVQVTELPTETRNPYDFVTLSGNASADSSATPRGVGVNLAGSRSASTEILLDGVENTYLFSVNVATPVPVDAVQEYRVLTSNYGPEYGRASGGVVNVVTKSGTNAFHGAAWEFYRPSTFASQATYLKAQGAAQHRFVRNEFGGVIGGPIVKDKLFFFGGNEWTRVRSSNLLYYYVPTQQFISMSNANTQGFFKQYGTLTGTAVGAPLTLGQIGGGTGAISSAFATDRTALERLNVGFTDSTPIFQQVAVTAAQDAGGGLPQNTYNSIGRLDFNLSNSTQMYARYVLFNEATPVGSNNVSPYAGYNTSFTQTAQDLSTLR